MLTPRKRWPGVRGLGIDLAADEARNLLPDGIPVDGLVPVGDEPSRSPPVC
jgi:hypothetical protein